MIVLSLHGRAVGSPFVYFLIASVLLLLAAPTTGVAAGARLSGRVVDPDQRPVSGARVVVSGALVTPREATSDGDGRFSMELEPGRYDVFASAPGLAAETRAVLVDAAGVSIDLVLRVAAVRETLQVSAAQVDQPLSRTPDSVTVLTGEDLETRQVFTLSSALRSVPGFTVAQSGGPGSLASLFPRGGESDYTLVLVDGVRANAFGGGLDLSQVPLENVDRIEVVRGPQSALYGSDAIGGVVHVITRQTGGPLGSARVEVGSRDARRIAGSAVGNGGAFRWQAGGDYYEDEGYTGAALANGEQVTNDDGREGQVSAGVGWRQERGTDVQGIFRYVETERGAPGAFGSDPAGRFGGVDRVARGSTFRRAFGVRGVHPWFGPDSRIRQRVEFDLADYDLGFNSAFGRTDSETSRAHLRVQTDAAASDTVGLSGGLEWIDEEASSTFITSSGIPVPVARRIIGTFGEGRWTGHPRATVTAGLRAEFIRRETLPGDPLAFQPRPDFPADTVTSVNPKIAASWQLTSDSPGSGAARWTRVRGAAGTGIRPPDAFEIAFTDNPTLKPERSRGFEVGLTQALAAGAVQLDVTAFFTEYDDLIISVGRFNSASPFRTDNISNARARGIEIGGAWRSRGGIDLTAAYTFLDAEILAVDRSDGQAPPPYSVGDRLLRRPRHQASIDARWTRGVVTVYGEIRVRGQTLDAEPAFGPTGGLYENPGYGVANLGGGVRIWRSVEVYGRIMNTFDESYEEVLGYPSPGRLGFIGVRVAAGR
jgi:outer membrane cobalamin receptor